MLRGVIPALLTPFTQGGAQVDIPALKRLCEHLVSARVSAVFATGTTGEFISLNPDERRLVIREVVRFVAGRMKVIIHVGSYNTAEAVALTKFAISHGVDAVASLPPYFHPLDDEAVFAYFGAIGEAAGNVPVYLYHLPAFAANSVSLPVMKRLKERYPAIRGTKDSSGDMDRLKEEVAMNLPDFDIILGADHHALDGLKIGSIGSVTSTANAFPEVFQAVYTAFDAGNLQEAERAQAKLTALTKVLKSGRYLARYKVALKLRGVDVGTVRPPQRELTDAEVAELRDGLKNLGLI